MTNLHIRTPVVESRVLSRLLERRVWLKLESLQPAGSFKTRGIGYACHEYVQRGAKKLLCSSGGNAGLAVAYSGRKLGVPVTVIVPTTTTERAKELIEQEDARVVVHGESWDESHEYARSILETDAAYIHPFDDPLIWSGHATMIDELREDGLAPGLMILSVGGGGLLCGVVEGLKRNGMDDVPVLAVETRGADSLFQAVQADALIELESIRSIAGTLGAKRVARQAFDYTREHDITPILVDDRDAIDACFSFARDHRLIVEPACGASLAVVYQQLDRVRESDDICVIVCGGVGVTLEQLQTWRSSEA